MKLNSIQPRLKERLSYLRESESLHLQVAQEMLQAYGGAVYPLDLLANAVLHRSINLVHGFATLVEQRNFVCAAALLRLQLDNCLRFYAAYLVKEPHDLASRVLRGEHIRKLRDKGGRLLTDAHLVNEFQKKHPWIKGVYDATSGYVHLSQAHIFNTFRPPGSDDVEGHVQVAIGKGDSFDTDAFYEEATEAFIEATHTLFHYLVGWVKTKENPVRPDGNQGPQASNARTKRCA